VVHCHEQIALLSKAAANAKIDVYLKLNSGMNRLGFSVTEFGLAYHRLRGMPQIGQIILMTHFANADEPSNTLLSTTQQMHCFNAACEGMIGEKSVANSAAILLLPELAHDWIRPGVMLYGATTGGTSAADFGLRAVMSLHSEIIGVQSIKAGEVVGYGSSFTASHAMRIGVVACGYADGYPRHAPSGTPVMVDGIRTSLVGRVSMDMLSVDLTPIPHAQVGTSVCLWGDSLPIDDVAIAAGTIGYELMCALAPRVSVQER
jgi:alanine racemase